MNACAKTTVLAFSLISLLAAPLADAARLGKGRSYGMRRAAPTQSYQRPAAAPQQQPLPAQTAPQPQHRRGSGIGTAVAAGAAGAAVGYLAGSAMNNNNAQAAPAQPTASAAAAAPAPAAAPVENKPAMPWNLIIVLGAIFLVGLLWFRRRMAAPGNAPQAMRPQPVPPADGGNRFDPIPPIGSGFPGAAGNNGGFQPQNDEPRRLPDGTETPYFLRQVKATFLHLQSLNSPETLDEVRRYMTPELFNELQGEIAGNGMVADFTNLDCRLLEAGEEMGRFVASVRFSGLVSEEVGATPMPFAETWHFIKDASTHDKWMVAGIQQS